MCHKWLGRKQKYHSPVQLRYSFYLLVFELVNTHNSAALYYNLAQIHFLIKVCSHLSQVLCMFISRPSTDSASTQLTPNSDQMTQIIYISHAWDNNQFNVVSRRVALML